MDATANEHKKNILHCHGAAIIGRRTGKVNTAVFMHRLKKKAFVNNTNAIKNT